jgi:heme o synthase
MIGGLAGSFAVMAGAAAADPTPGPLPLLLALVLFLWTPPHFWSLAIANRADYETAGVPMLPVVVGTERAAWIVFASTVALVAASLPTPAIPARLAASACSVPAAMEVCA